MIRDAGVISKATIVGRKMLRAALIVVLSGAAARASAASWGVAKHDGLVWYNADGTLGGPIAVGIAKALQQGYTDKSKPYHWSLLQDFERTGPAAPLRNRDFSRSRDSAQQVLLGTGQSSQTACGE